MKILFLDIDGYVVKADIQKYVSRIELFGDEPIKDFEYIKKCIEYMLKEAKKNNSSDEHIRFIENVYTYVSGSMFEMLKEYRDCFLEYDNLVSFEEKKEYYEHYQKNPVSDFNNAEIPKYMEYIIGSLKLAKVLIEREVDRVKREGGTLNLPFNVINEDNDIISYNDNDTPLEMAKRALNRMELYAMNRENRRDDFLTACSMIGNNQVVDYNEIYTKEHIIPGAVEGLKYMLETSKVDMIVVCSHFTGTREGIAKKRLFEEEFPFAVMLPESLLKFHTEAAQMGKRRVRSSKDEQINAMCYRIAQWFDLDVKNIEAILGDDSFPNLETLNGKTGILYRPLTTKEIETGSYNPINSKYIRQIDWSKEEIENIFSRINSRGNEDTPKRFIKK